jgi:ParB family transcriptional regulator, chromosome partitioning protein
MTPPLKRRALGRGLDALIPQTVDAAAPADVHPIAPLRSGLGRDFCRLPIEDVHPSPEQPRHTFDEIKLDELAQSVRSHGVIQPIVVRERSPAEGGGFWLIAGERRWRAAQRAGLHEIPAIVREATPARAFEMALIENVQRDDLNPIEEAEAYRRLSDDHGLTQEQLAERVGKDRTTITNALRLLKLPPPVRGLVSEGALSMGHARALLGLEDPQAITSFARRVAARSLSVRATEELVRRERSPTRPRRPREADKSAGVRDLEQRLTRALGARVTIHHSAAEGGGRIEIGYANLDDLDRLLDRLAPAP